MPRIQIASVPRARHFSSTSFSPSRPSFHLQTPHGQKKEISSLSSSSPACVVVPKKERSRCASERRVAGDLLSPYAACRGAKMNHRGERKRVSEKLPGRQAQSRTTKTRCTAQQAKQQAKAHKPSYQAYHYSAWLRPGHWSKQATQLLPLACFLRSAS